MIIMWAILTIRVENKPGILFKVTHLFRSRNFNIDSISVGVTEDPNYSRMTITTIGDETVSYTHLPLPTSDLV